MTIPSVLIACAIVGLVVSLYPSWRWGCTVLCVVPVAILFIIHAELSDPARRPDALDAINYIVGPLWASLGALGGFLFGRAIRHWMSLRKTRDEE